MTSVEDCIVLISALDHMWKVLGAVIILQTVHCKDFLGSLNLLLQMLGYYISTSNDCILVLVYHHNPVASHLMLFDLQK